jgi:hypothetical protein
MLNGRVEVAISMGLRRKPQGIANAPLNWTRWRVSKLARPYSGRTLYESEGKVPAPSVSLSALPSVYEPLKEILGLMRAFRLVTSWC